VALAAILRALGLGDLLIATPALRALAHALADHRRVLAAPAVLQPLLPLIDPELELAPVGELQPLPRWLRGADVAVNLHGRGPQSHRLLLDAKRQLWFEHPDVPESCGAPRWRAGEHERLRWCRMLAEHGIPADPDALAIRPPAGRLPASVEGATIIHPGSASVARRWPWDRYVDVARAERGRPVVITGNRAEAPLAHAIAAGAGLDPRCVLAGRTDLLALTRAVAVAGRIVCGDTGIGHLATALGTPSVLLFGPTSPAEWGPPPERTCHRVIWHGPQPGGGDPHAERPDPALLAIEPAEVIEALAELPERAAALTT
jgi:ADP-heptose:LPS heptosyltransferase